MWKDSHTVNVDDDGLGGCRFCFDALEDDESGKLIKPCLCR